MTYRKPKRQKTKQTDRHLICNYVCPQPGPACAVDVLQATVLAVADEDGRSDVSWAELHDA